MATTEVEEESVTPTTVEEETRSEAAVEGLLPAIDSTAGAACHGSECTGSKKALGSYGRSIGVRDQADPQRSRPWPMDEEMLEKAWSECNLHGECSLHGDHGHGGPGRMHGDPSTATRRTELKEHTDGSHSGARETRVKGTVTGQREGVVYRRPARPANRS
ncbi:uncharacterized protein UHOD_11038 [Ustilago sp. UG-2017b]|nr:uncharacterized protein UHOD_11035 [Ustilago sp. UG-2017b]SPC65213.1 uncharacterized protein UHOD_11036 [Ustilago sp. UG-2017b]SPC65214.1 uncharacterized protein UHOD_11037 [Ustilago sp. UG-2017b]SPC65215.1 uncharacterized protein UHOD_11038 [Ustilago sp. UG-2017b]